MLKKYILFILLFLSVFGAFSQSLNNTLYFLQNSPQSNKLNPAIMPEYNVWIGFPGISSIYLNYSNNSFSVEDILHKGKGINKDSVVIDINSFHSALKNTNTINLTNENTFFAFGFRANKSYITFDISQKNDLMFGFDKDMVTFLKNGNAGYLGKTFDFGNLQLNGSVYNQIALGYAREFGEKKDFIVGVKFKLLFGVSNVDMTDSEMSVYTNNDASLIRLKSKQIIRASMPLNIVRDADGYVNFDDLDFNDDNIDAKFYTGTENKGFGIDIGAQYKVNEDLTLSASIIDLGMIKWKANTYEFYQDASFDWKGGDWSQSGNSDAPDYKEIGDVMDDLVDSLGDKFQFMDREKAYSTPLHAKLYVGGSYKLKDWVTVGALSRTQFYYGNIVTSLTLSANTRVCRNVSASMSYTAANNSYTNLGFGLTAKLGCLQFYAVTDNLMAANFTKTQLVNFRFGLNMLFGHKDRKKNKKYDLKEKESVRNL